MNSVDLPAPFGPITAVMPRSGTARLTPPTAVKPLNDLADVAHLKHRAVSAMRASAGMQRADDAAGKDEQQHDQDRAEDERPVLRVGGDLLVEQDQHRGADRRAPEMPMPPRIAMISTSADFAQ